MTEEEHWARAIVARHLRRPVEPHDTGEADGMFDLVARGDGGLIDFAIEVTQAMVESHRKQASALSGRRRIAITGNGWRWIAWLRPEASGNRAKADIAALIAQFERMLEQAATADGSSGIDLIDSTGIRLADGSRANRVALDAGPFEALQRLHIPTLIRSRATDSSPSTVSLEPMPGEAGLIDECATSLSGWISDFARDERRADNLTKLRVEAPHKELFVFACALQGLPWAIDSYLLDWSKQPFQLPSVAPDLPEPLTGVWVCSTAATRCVRYTNETGWAEVDTIVAGEPEGPRKPDDVRFRRPGR